MWTRDAKIFVHKVTKVGRREIMLGNTSLHCLCNVLHRQSRAPGNNVGKQWSTVSM